jgi:transmembrane sensor
MSIAKTMRSSSSSHYSERQLKQAIEWFVCLQSELYSAEEQLRFETWLEKNENHHAAYAEAERVWANMDDLKFMPIPGLDEARSAKPQKSLAAQLASLAFFILTSALLGGVWLDIAPKRSIMRPVWVSAVVLNWRIIPLST